MRRKKEIRFAVQTFDAELAQLAQLPAGTLPPSLITNLFESWGELMGLLALDPLLGPYRCPRCGHTVEWEAQRCGHCWATLGSTVASDA